VFFEPMLGFPKSVVGGPTDVGEPVWDLIECDPYENKNSL